METLKEKELKDHIRNQKKSIESNITLLESTLDDMANKTFVDGCRTTETLYWEVSDILGELIKHKKRLEYVEIQQKRT